MKKAPVQPLINLSPGATKFLLFCAAIVALFALAKTAQLVPWSSIKFPEGMKTVEAIGSTPLRVEPASGVVADGETFELKVSGNEDKAFELSIEVRRGYSDRYKVDEYRNVTVGWPSANTILIRPAIFRRSFGAWSGYPKPLEVTIFGLKDNIRYTLARIPVIVTEPRTK